MQTIKNPRIERGYVLKLHTERTTPGVVINVTEENDPSKILINNVAVKLTKTNGTPSGGLEEFEVDLKAAEPRAKFNPKKKYKFHVGAVDADGNMEGDWVRADSREVDPKEEQGFATWEKVAILAAVIIVVGFLCWYFLGVNDSKGSYTPQQVQQIVDEEVEKALAKAKADAKVATTNAPAVTPDSKPVGPVADIPSVATTNTPPTTAEGKPKHRKRPVVETSKADSGLLVPSVMGAPLIGAKPDVKKEAAKAPPCAPKEKPEVATNAPTTAVITGKTNETVHVPHGGDVKIENSANVVVNYGGEIKGGVHLGTGKKSKAEAEAPVALSWPNDSVPEMIFEIMAQGCCDDPSVTCRKVSTELPPGVDYAYRYPDGWLVAVEAAPTNAQVQCAFNVRTDEDAKWILTRDYKGGKVRSLRLHNLEQQPVKITFTLTREQ